MNLSARRVAALQGLGGVLFEGDSDDDGDDDIHFVPIRRYSSDRQASLLASAFSSRSTNFGGSASRAALVPVVAIDIFGCRSNPLSTSSSPAAGAVTKSACWYRS